MMTKTTTFSKLHKQMGSVFDHIIAWVPWAMGVTNASIMAYYANNFVTSDVDLSRGKLSGTSGNVLLGTSAASIAVQTWAILEFIKYHVKKGTGELTVHGANHKYMMAREWYLGFMFLFFIVAIVSAALDIALVSDYSAQKITIRNGKLNGAYGDAVEGMAYTTVAVAALPLFTFIGSEIFARKWESGDRAHRPMIAEMHVDL